jgi:two-component system, OmpR family, KDP operon response regulator KdpE
MGRRDEVAGQGMLTRPRVVVSNPDPGICRLLRRQFSAAGCVVHIASLGQDAVQLIHRSVPEISVVSTDFQDLGGLDLIRAVRNVTANPIIALIREQSPSLPSDVLDAGADDCIVEPFLVEELSARFRRLLQRVGVVLGHAAFMTSVGKLETIARNDMVLLDGHPISLTRNEAHLLGLLIGARGTTLSHDEIIRKIWGLGHSGSRQNLRRTVVALRRKLEPNSQRPRLLKSVPGDGYRITILSERSGASDPVDPSTGSGSFNL